jgi:hypothetical protein
MNRSKLIYTLVLALAPQLLAAQQFALHSPVDAAGSAEPSAVVSTSDNAPANAKSLTDRWLQLETLSHSERYRNAFQVGGGHNFENAQQRSLIQGKLKLDAEGRYDIGFRASSGRYFNWAFSNFTGEGFVARGSDPSSKSFYTPAEQFEVTSSVFADPAGFKLLLGTAGVGGIQSNGWEFYMRELYFSATPVKPVTVEFGSFGIERGYSTEITTFDEDGYLSGERIRLHDPKHLFFDEVAFTNAYFGDLDTVNLFDRGSSLKQFNYRQVAAKKQLNNRVAISGEYTWQTGIDTLREALVVKTPEVKVIDRVRFEAYERLNSITFAGLAQSYIGPIAPLTVKGASGFAVAFDKKLGKLSGDIGFATIDSNYSVYANSRSFHAVDFSLNGDTYGLGNRPFAHASYKIAPGVTAFGFYTHEVGSTRVPTYNQQGLNAGVTFDLKAMVNTTKHVF